MSANLGGASDLPWLDALRSHDDASVRGAVPDLAHWSRDCTPEQLVEGLTEVLRSGAHRRALAVYFELLGRRQVPSDLLLERSTAALLRDALRSPRLAGIRGKLALSLSRHGRHAATFVPDIFPLRRARALCERRPSRRALRRILTDVIERSAAPESLHALRYLVRCFNAEVHLESLDAARLPIDVARAAGALSVFVRNLSRLRRRSEPEFQRLWCAWIELTPLDTTIWRP